MKINQLPPTELLNELFEIKDDGTLVSKKTIKRRGFLRKKGQKVGYLKPNREGYLYVRIGQKQYANHRVIYAMVHGSVDPNKQIDHINGNRSDNRPSNLRLVTNSENQRNRRNVWINTNSGFTGIFHDKRHNRWTARIGYNGKSIHLGSFQKLEDAIIARKRAEKKYNYTIV